MSINGCMWPTDSAHASQDWHCENFIFAHFSEFSMKPRFSAKTWFNLWGVRESNLARVSPTGCQRGRWIPFKSASSWPTDPDVSLVEGVISHFHFSLKKKLKASHCTRRESICIFTSQSLAAAKKFLWQICPRSPTSSCSWRCWAEQCPSIGFPCWRSMLDPRPGSPTSCHRSYLQVSQTQPENLTIRRGNIC